MANKFFDTRKGMMVNRGGGKPPAGRRGSKPGFGPEKTAAWPSVPGKTQPSNRSGGTKKVKQSMKDTGI